MYTPEERLARREELKKALNANEHIKSIKKIVSCKKKLMKMFIAGDSPKDIIKK
jgi:hypothetical protein